MRAITLDERKLVAAGLIKAPSPGDGDGGGGGSGQSPYYSGSNPMLGRQDVQQLADSSGLTSLLMHDGLTVIRQQAPNASLGNSSIVGKIIYIPDNISDNYSAGDTVEQIAHELGHFEHPVDAQPLDYLTEGVYANAQLTGEGWAQMQAIQTALTFIPNESIPSIPGNPAFTSEESAAYFSGLSEGRSLNDIAQDIGFIMGDQPLNQSTGETYSDWLSGNWDSAWSDQSSY